MLMLTALGLTSRSKPSFAPRGIGVSVLCPGFIRTKIMNSRRNVPQRFAGAIEEPPPEGPHVEIVKMFEERVSAGIDPLYVSELVRAGSSMTGRTSSPTMSSSH
jgi:NAD(P)-dependent dehydrogenase (short-subunit alcohol dehydrogenase family)